MVTITCTAAEAEALQHAAWRDRIGHRPHRDVFPDEGDAPVKRPDDATIEAAYATLQTAIAAGA